ncbi:ESX secretion-associated protein EspG [Nocardia sp. NPDC050435]|uniref:ESX secretion-associated protein EspG n=1 Tax=Nocardia sp. NPDC050435 TaxID=3155040 RepID=UPI003408F1BF
MSRTWKFTDIEFMALWSRTQGTLLPRPFTYICEMRTNDEYERALHEVRERWRGTDDRVLDEIIQAVLEPDISLEVRGFDEREYERAQGWVRALAVRRGERGFVLKQVTGKTFEHAESFTVTECDPLGLAEAVVAELPKCEPGKHGSIKLPVARGEEMVEANASGLWDDPYGGASTAVTGERFEKTIAASRGVVRVSQGYSVYGPRGRISLDLKWRDLPDDGRYVIAPDTPPVAQPADEKKFVIVLNQQIAKIIRNIKDERQSHRV